MTEPFDEFLQWLECTDMTERLRNSLRRFHQLFPDVELDKIQKEDFCSMDFVGKGQWKEFVQLKDNK